MDIKKTNRDQFNKQAENFSGWEVTQNIEYMQRYFEFCGMSENDDLLDVACGSGEFAIFCAQRVRQVTGVDISENMIELAQKKASAAGQDNVHFEHMDVDDLKFKDGSYSFVTCKSAFHHFAEPWKVFSEMVRCCKNNGMISVQDITAYDEDKVNDFFERLEKAIDLSHNRTLAEDDFTELFVRGNAEVIRTYKIEVELDFKQYLNHAVQTEGDREKSEIMLKQGLEDPELAEIFVTRGDILFFKRNVFLILGRKT